MALSYTWRGGVGEGDDGHAYQTLAADQHMPDDGNSAALGDLSDEAVALDCCAGASSPGRPDLEECAPSSPEGSPTSSPTRLLSANGRQDWRAAGCRVPGGAVCNVPKVDPASGACSAAVVGTAMGGCGQAAGQGTMDDSTDSSTCIATASLQQVAERGPV